MTDMFRPNLADFSSLSSKRFFFHFPTLVDCGAPEKPKECVSENPS